jgi:hypothetical protein
VRPKFSIRSNNICSLIRHPFSAPRAYLAEAIRKCFQHSGFDTELSFSEDIETDFVPLEDPDGWERFSAGLPFAVFIECDRDVAICGTRTDSEIIAEVTGLWDHSASEQSEKDTEEESAPPPPPTPRDAISAVGILNGYLCTRQMSEADEGCLSGIQRLLYRLVWLEGDRQPSTVFCLSDKFV